MKTVVVDSSALAAVVFKEPAAPVVARQLEGATVFAPGLLKFELANVAWKKMRVAGADRPAILSALAKALEPRRGMVWHEVQHTDAVLIARQTGLSTYAASYVWLAGWLGADLVTLDQRLVAAVSTLSAV